MKGKERSHASTGQRYLSCACSLSAVVVWLRLYCSVTRQIIVSLFRLKALHKPVMPWFLRYPLLYWRGGPSFIFAKESHFTPRPRESKQCILTTRSGVLNHVLWQLLTGHRNSGAFPRWKRSTALRTGSKIFYTSYP